MRDVLVPAPVSHTASPNPDAPTGVQSLVREKILAEFPDAPVMLRIAQAESQLTPGAHNPHSSAKGLFQILDGSWVSYGCTGNVLNPDDNIACARKLYDADGTRPWLSSSAHW